MGPCVPFWSIFLRKKISLDDCTNLGWESLTELSLSNIMKYGKYDIEWNTSILGLCDLGIIWGKEKEALSLF